MSETQAVIEGLPIEAEAVLTLLRTFENVYAGKVAPDSGDVELSIQFLRTRLIQAGYSQDLVGE